MESEAVYICPKCGREQIVTEFKFPRKLQCLMPYWGNRKHRFGSVPKPCTGRLVRKETEIERPRESEPI
jgi:hypothetical protein